MSSFFFNKNRRNQLKVDLEVDENAKDELFESLDKNSVYHDKCKDIIKLSTTHKSLTNNLMSSLFEEDKGEEGMGKRGEEEMNMVEKENRLNEFMLKYDRD